MKLKFTKTNIFTLLLLPVVAYFGITTVKNNNVKSIKAAGDLSIYQKIGANFILLNGNPLFNVDNMAPGDSETAEIKVENNDPVARYLAVKANSVNGMELQEYLNNYDESTDPLEKALLIEITMNGSPIYPASIDTTLHQFFVDSNDENGILLGIVDSTETAEFEFIVHFPSGSGNEFQGKSVVFDLVFGVITGESIVINEVYYNVARVHGLESFTDRGLPEKERKKGINNEWVELYNPTENEISLKNWTLETSLGTTKINANKKIKAGGFALVSKDASTWKYWNEEKDAVKVELGQEIAGGLKNSGDTLKLINPQGVLIDDVSWCLNSYPCVSSGESIERLTPGYDTDSASDWYKNDNPSPGN